MAREGTLYNWRFWFLLLAVGVTRVHTLPGQNVLPNSQNSGNHGADVLDVIRSSEPDAVACNADERQVRRYDFSPALFQTLRRLDIDIWASTPRHIDAYIPSCKSVIQELEGHAYQILPVPLPPAPTTQRDDPKFQGTPLVGPLHDLKNLSHPFHSEYHNAHDISIFLESLAYTFPEEVTLIHVGHSYEGRPITGVKIAKSTPPKHGEKPRNGFIIIGAQHAREWIASSTALYLAHALAARHDDQSHEDRPFVLSHLLNEFEFHIIPLPNPDGHEYTHTVDRLWYKNRQTVSHAGHTVCKGIDMNRNWGYEWLPANDPSSDPCSHWYPGSRPFEAHEVNAIASYLTYRTGAKVSAFLDLRSYGQMISAPYSYSCDTLPRDAEDIIEAALGAAQASARIHGMPVSTGRLCETLYSAPGNIIDWTYSREDIKYSYATHLRDTGTFGFLIPEEWIRPSGEETAALVNYLANFIYKDPKTT